MKVTPYSATLLTAKACSMGTQCIVVWSMSHPVFPKDDLHFLLPVHHSVQCDIVYVTLLVGLLTAILFQSTGTQCIIV